MGKNDFLTPKAIANRIKAKGLQKLRWYCQMCQKQCRDENGFKCHCMSESHQRQMQVFGQNPTRVVDGYSEEFEQTFLDLMRRSHRFSRIAATVVYNEYINDRHHVHMNSTEWATLTEFIKYLGKTGKCKVEETPKGWFITYIDRDSETMFKERLKNKRVKSDLAEEEKQEREIQRQIERAAEKLNAAGGSEGESSGKEVVEDNDVDDEKKKKDEELKLKSGVKVGFALGGGVKQVATGKEKVESSKIVFEDEENDKVEREDKRKRSGDSGRSEKEKRSALDDLMKEEENKKERMNRKDYWLFEGIIVKVMSKALAKKGYYKQKGVVKKVIDKYVGEIEMLDSKHVLRVDQEELETVIPQIGGTVKIVNGAYRGSNARLLGLDTEKFCAKVQIEKGVYDGRVIKSIDYEDICKLA
ncbi:PREDICTED: DNA/RNA-binding protein KIN17-like [Camelina sativa]|uniref:DNA/RNA-binding protein KIN17-like n=1 Tax=Camelina sativa TaxID=90675 RepID=A0ABM0YI01_CAMSA|nr:PREDICTED: DNA/RNA-binding protein KIN17-like [Camelina sativa]